MPTLPERCSAEESVTQVDADQAYRDGRIEAVHIHELTREQRDALGVSNGYHVSIKMRRSRPRYLVTQRERNAPRLFRHLERLYRLLDDLCPDTPVTLHRDRGRR